MMAHAFNPNTADSQISVEFKASQDYTVRPYFRKKKKKSKNPKVQASKTFPSLDRGGVRGRFPYPSKGSLAFLYPHNCPTPPPFICIFYFKGQ